MPDPVFYIRGIPPFAERDLTNAAMVADLKVIAELSEQEVGQLVGRLTGATGFLDPKKLRGVLQGVLPEERVAAAVRRALQNLDPDDVESLLHDLDTRRKTNKKIAIDDPQMAAIRRNLGQLVQSYPALKRFEKAARLATLTGQQLESIDLICDLRPIFDDSRKKIEGMMPYTRLRVVATGADGLPCSFEAELTAKQLQELLDKARKAEAKIAALREATEAWLPEGIPDLPLTRIPREELSDG
jgi:hypothetical protein